MSESIEVPVFLERWSIIASLGSGFITNESDNIVKYKEAEIQPSDNDTVGHTLQRRADVRYELNLPLKVWGKIIIPNITIGTDAIVIVTPD